MSHQSKKRYQKLLLILVLTLVVVALISLLVGPTGLAWTDLRILRYRFSRIVLAIVVGSSLAASGASLQALFKNPLADPHLFGISGGASVGACLALAFFTSFTVLPSLGAILGGMLAFLVLFSYLRSSYMLNNCLLVGILINSLAASIITLLKIALPAHRSQSLLFWLLGHVGAVAERDFLLIIPLWFLGLGLLWSLKGRLEILSFGFDEGRLLGLDPEKISRLAIIANCILIGNAVAWAGMIGFLGLFTPHLVRILISADLKILLPLSSLLGAIIMLVFDSLSRLSFWFFGSEIPVGALCAIFLAPPFFLLLFKGQKDVSHNH